MWYNRACTKRPCPAEIFLGSYTILQQVHTQSIRYHRTIAQTDTQRRDLEMGHSTRKKLQETERDAISWECLSTLQPRSWHRNLMWCFRIWTGSCSISSLSWWKWATNSQCFKNTDQYTDEIWTNTKRSSLNHICSKEVSPVPVRSTIHFSYWQQTSSKTSKTY